MQVMAMQNETVDAICFRVYGKTKGMSELVFKANQGLAEHGVILPTGLMVDMPQASQVTEATNIVQLWD